MPPISRDRFDDPQRRPKPRPAGYSFQPRPGSSGPPARPNSAPRPKPRSASNRSAGPARVDPVQPTSGKQRRRMAKAAAWRLAKLLHARPAEILAADDLQPILERALPKLNQEGGRGDAARLAAKVRRLAVRK